MTSPRQHYPIPPMAPEFAPRSQKHVTPILTRPTGLVRLIDSGFIPLLDYSAGDRGWRRVAPVDDAELRAIALEIALEKVTKRETAQRTRRARPVKKPKPPMSEQAKRGLETKRINKATRTRARIGDATRKRNAA